MAQMISGREIDAHLEEAERKAFDALSRYKFAMFGYWAAIWVHWNRAGNAKKSNPFRGLVHAAKTRVAEARAVEAGATEEGEVR